MIGNLSHAQVNSDVVVAAMTMVTFEEQTGQSEPLDFWEIPMDKFWIYQQYAMEKLHLTFTGLTHSLWIGFGRYVGGLLLGAVNEGEILTEAHLFETAPAIAAAWNQAWNRWVGMLQAARYEAARISLSTVARIHVHYATTDLEEAGFGVPWRSFGQARAMEEAKYPMGVENTPFDADIARFLTSTETHMWSDNFNLPTRLMRHTADGLTGLRTTISDSIAEGMSTREIVDKVDTYLGASQKCPRWTQARLALTPQDLAQSREGLARADACATRGLSYKTLKLARTEMQVAHHSLLSHLFGVLPFVQYERIHLSPYHPWGIGCICEQYYYSGTDGRGLHPKGVVQLPGHPLCQCALEAILITKDEFQEKFNRWLSGQEPWPEMDRYLEQMGVSRFQSLPPSPVPPVDPGGETKRWWLLLLALAAGYKLWASNRKDDAQKALQAEEIEW